MPNDLARQINRFLKEDLIELVQDAYDWSATPRSSRYP